MFVKSAITLLSLSIVLSVVSLCVLSATLNTDVQKTSKVSGVSLLTLSVVSG